MLAIIHTQKSPFQALCIVTCSRTVLFLRCFRGNVLGLTTTAKIIWCIHAFKIYILWVTLSEGWFPLRKIILGSDRIGTKFNLNMRLRCQFFAQFKAILYLWTAHLKPTENWHWRHMSRLNFVPMRSDPRTIFLSGNQPWTVFFTTLTYGVVSIDWE